MKLAVIGWISIMIVLAFLAAEAANSLVWVLVLFTTSVMAMFLGAQENAFVEDGKRKTLLYAAISGLGLAWIPFFAKLATALAYNHSPVWFNNFMATYIIPSAVIGIALYVYWTATEKVANIYGTGEG